MSKQAVQTIGGSVELRPRTLLLAVDDRAIHELVQDLLADTEWIVDCVEEGEDALARLEVCSYDLILTDLIRPGMNEAALVSCLRKRHPEAHTVVMTVKNAPRFRDVPAPTLETSSFARRNARDTKVLLDRPTWISPSCLLASANHPAEFTRGLLSDLNRKEREQVTASFRGLLLNAVEHRGHSGQRQTVDLNYMRAPDASAPVPIQHLITTLEPHYPLGR